MPSLRMTPAGVIAYTANTAENVVFSWLLNHEPQIVDLPELNSEITDIWLVDMGIGLISGDSFYTRVWDKPDWINKKDQISNLHNNTSLKSFYILGYSANDNNWILLHNEYDRCSIHRAPGEEIINKPALPVN